VASVSTVTGPVQSDHLGLTLVHEHIRTYREPVHVQFPHLYDEALAFQTAVRQVNAARALGVRTICDPTVMGLGRDVRFLRAVSEATDVLIVPSTGIYTLSDLPPYFETRSIDHMTDAFVHDIVVGIQGTDIRAGFLKCATDKAGMTPAVEKVLRAVSRAHRATGVPIMTHSNPRTGSGLQQQDVFEEEGVDVAGVLIGHCGDTEDITYLERVAERGSYLGMDRYGLSDKVSTAGRNQTVVAMCQLGYSNQLMLSQDSVTIRDMEDAVELQPLRENWTLTYLLSEVLPQLQDLGVSNETLEQMLKDNVRSWLEPRAPY
jgi:phosphotriesterase-related protein